MQGSGTPRNRGKSVVRLGPWNNSAAGPELRQFQNRPVPVSSLEAGVGPAQPPPTIGRCLPGGPWLARGRTKSKTRASFPLDAIRRPRNTPLWKLEASLKCRSCRKGRYAPPVHMIKLTERREITPYKWVHPDEERE
jgi:hypothetical protein